MPPKKTNESTEASVLAPRGAPSRYGLDEHGLRPRSAVYWNLPPAGLYEQAVARGEGRVLEGGPFAVTTAPHTGRSPRDRYIVRDGATSAKVDWGEVNRPMDPAHFLALRDLVRSHLEERDLFVKDARAGDDPSAGMAVRVVSPSAWHTLFAHNMFLRLPRESLASARPDFTVLHAPELEADPVAHGTRSGAFVVIAFEARTVLIGGTRYAGEIKKSIFTVLNFLLPDSGVLPMHCSANIGEKGDSALFFGLSGTGKTTLSADPRRGLIGDDEHGWGSQGVFNFEGGCYAKVIRLSTEEEPEISQASRMFGTVLENVVSDPLTHEPDFDDASITENTRSSYPIHYIPNAVVPGRGPHPRNVIFLTCDAFGVLPPISRLDPASAMYHFLSGYTAKVAGTERGVTEPEATFSAGFGQPFLPRVPGLYAEMLGERLREQASRVWFINTGWTGGGPGVGRRISLAHTRAMVTAAIEGALDDVRTRRDPVFGLETPVGVPGVPAEILDPRGTWPDGGAYDEVAARLSAMFKQNFRIYEGQVERAVAAAGPS
jgi:phosphoenolpyruvate carboxykinase (ATP)